MCMAHERIDADSVVEVGMFYIAMCLYFITHIVFANTANESTIASPVEEMGILYENSLSLISR